MDSGLDGTVIERGRFRRISERQSAGRSARLYQARVRLAMVLNEVFTETRQAWTALRPAVVPS